MKKRIMPLMAGMLLLLTACGQTGNSSASTMLPVAAVQSAAQGVAGVADKTADKAEMPQKEEKTEGSADTPLPVERANASENADNAAEKQPAPAETPPPTTPGQAATPAPAPEDKPAPAPTPAPTQKPAEKQEEEPAPELAPTPEPEPAPTPEPEPELEYEPADCWAAVDAANAYAASVTVKYRVYVYSDEITFRQYDYSQSTTPSITNLTISATSGLGSGSALYHMKYADGAVAYCIEPGVHSDDSGTYKEGSSASWYNLPASVQSGIALAMSLGYPSADYGTASGDRNSSAIINAEKWAATQAVIWELICEYRNAYTYDDWGYSPFYGCVDTSRYPTFGLWYDEIAAAMQNATIIPSFAEYAPRWCDTIELRRTAAGSYTATVTDTNGVLSAYNFAANSGSGIAFSRKGNALTITATAAAAKNLDTEKTYSATGSAYEIDPDRAVICWYDRTGRYQAMAGYTGVGRDPVKAYIKIKAVEEKGSLTINKVVATGAPLAGAKLLLETSADGKTWTEVGRVTTDKTGIAKWSDLKVGVQYRVTETKAPAGYTLLTEPLFTGTLDSRPMIILTRTFVLDLANSAWAAFSLSCSSVCRYSRSTWLTLMVGYPWIRLPIMTLSFSSAIV